MSYSLKKTGLECLIVGSLYLSSPSLAENLSLNSSPNKIIPGSTVGLLANVSGNNNNFNVYRSQNNPVHNYGLKENDLEILTKGSVCEKISLAMKYTVCFGFPMVLYYSVFFHPYIRRRFIRNELDYKTKDIGSSA
jgi:hypothetical protein